MALRTRLIVALAVAVLLVGAGGSIGSVQEPKPDPPKPKRIEIAITQDGFSPGRVDVQPGVALELVFTRTTDKTCATEVAVPSLKVKRPLPLNEPVTIALTPAKDDVSFSCGMNMLKGKLVVR